MLPDWKQLLLERKRREEEEREKRDREEEERLASMPAWKRGIIHRRKAKQEGGGEKDGEKVREAGREFEPKTVSVEPIWKNYFIFSQNGFTREQQRKEMEKGNNEGKRQRESNYERMSGEKKEKYKEREDNRGKWIQMERIRERDIIEGMKERESDADRGRKVGERDDVLSTLVSGIHTIKAENIIIIENRKNQREKVESDGERKTEEGKKQGMDLKEFLAGGEKVTEICVSEVLIIQPSIKEERSKEDRKQGNEDEKKRTLGVIEREGGETECRRVSQLIGKFERHDGVIRTLEREKEQEEDLLGENYIAPSQSSSSSSSPPPPLGHTQPAMSRIYNLKPATSRAGVCITERNLDVQAHSGGIIKIRSGGQFAPGPPKIASEIVSLRSVQRQVEQLNLKEQEVQRRNDGGASQKQNVCETGQEQNVDMQKSQTHTISKPSSELRVQTQLPQISTSTTKNINTQIEPTVTTPSTPLFTIRSASGGPGKRGATFTITPRTPSSSVTTLKVSSSSSKTSKAPSNTPELSKKRYPTAEEIEVIGGYQHLERSCLVKNRGSPKMVRVRFDDSQLECVSTYPSEESMVGEEGSSDDWWRMEEKKEEKDEEEDEDGVIGAGRGMNRVLRVDESCRR
ncbi:hypothetical protein PHYPO_G00239100 [Pangasianodon hypophthalmus]|uniref:Phostensin/Taperin PP1-binding domain-containing protein n=1 Tax=Pangasianodon hypophthalmus TaxID=310915 RepID=A0A5N5NC73_PANHP|nr:hypothetical protein PHYPO_G00239100 [Pangasianodon hypophthalmus]